MEGHFLSYNAYVNNFIFEQESKELLNEGFKYFDKELRNKLVKIGDTKEISNDDLIKHAHDFRLMISALVYIKNQVENTKLSKLRQSLIEFFTPTQEQTSKLGILKAAEEAVKHKIENLSDNTLNTIKDFLMYIIKYIPTLDSNQVIELSGSDLSNMTAEVKTINIKK